jgi:hypothetical protein
LSGDNLWRDRRGRRHCVTCRVRRTREAYYRRTGNRTAPDVPYHASETHCRRGHARTDATTYIDKAGLRVCRVCQSEHQRAYRAKRRSHQSAASETGR